MSRFARVGSIALLKEFRGSLCIFAELASSVMDEADAEIQRTILWLKQEQSSYWKNQLRQRHEKFIQAKLALERKKNIDQSPLGGKYSYIDEKKAFSAAQGKLEEAQQKLEKVKKWIVQLEHEVFNYKGTVQGLASVVGQEIPNANSQIDKMVTALESYTALAPPVETPPAPATLSTDESAQTEGVTSITRETAPPFEQPDDPSQEESAPAENHDSDEIDDSEGQENHESKS